MLNVKTIITCLFIFCSNGFLSAQSLSFDHLTTLNGLTTNSVRCITQDYRGFMWFGTSSGLNRFDGVNFKKYHKGYPSENNSISNDYIYSLVADSNTLWIGTAVGLNKMNIETNKIERILVSGSDSGVSNKDINCLYKDRERNIWVGTFNGLNLLTNRTKNSFTKFYADKAHGIAGNYIACIFEDDEGTIWIGTNNGLTRMIKKNNFWQFETIRNEQNNKASLSSNDISAIAQDVAHNIWIGTANNGLNLFDKKTGTFSLIEMPGITGNSVRTIKNDGEGKLWIGTSNGIFILDPLTRSYKLYQHYSSEPKSINQNTITSIFHDTAGSAWVGTFLGGVNVAHPHSAVFSTWQSGNTNNSLSDDVVTGITEDKKLNLLISTRGGGLNYLDRKTGIISRYRHDPKNKLSVGSDFQESLYRDPEGEIWIGTIGGGLNLFNPESGTFSQFVFDPSNPSNLNKDIISLLEDSHQRFWVGTQNGIRAYKKLNHALLPDESVIISGRLSSTLVYSIIEDWRQNIWVGTVTGLYLLKKNEKSFSTIDSMGTIINCLYEDKNKHMWVGVYNSGLIEYDLSTGKMKNYTISESVPGNQVLSILGDEQDNLWLATDIGLCRFNRNDSAVHVFNTGEGITVGGSVRNSAYKAKNGEFFFGGQNGLVSFFPDKMQNNNNNAPLVFTSLKLFNNRAEVQADDKLLTKDISLTDKITFRYNQNMFTISFALLNYINADKNRYAYKLDGLDKDWNPTANNFITYTRLPPGKYTLQLKGANSDGVWSKQVSLNIEILPAPWKTGWAYLIYLLLFGCMLFFIVRHFFRQEVQKIKLQSQI